MIVDSYLLGVSFAVLSAFMYSLASILYRYSLNDVDPILVTALRALPALLTIFIVTLVIGEFNDLVNVGYTILFYGFLAGALGMMMGAYFYMRALKFGGVSIGFPSSFSYPVFVSAIASLFLKETITFGIISGLGSTLIGILVLASSNNNSSIQDPLKGAINGLFASIMWAISIIVSKIALTSYPPVSFATIRLFFASLVAIPLILANHNAVKITATNLSLISLGGILGIGLGIVFAHIALVYVGAIVSAIVSASSPALSLILAKIFLKEEITPRQLVGVILVIIGTLLTFF